MKKLALTGIILLLCIFLSCKQDRQKVTLVFDNPLIDSCTVDIYHYISGEKLHSTSFTNLSGEWVLDSLPTDMYVLSISWQRRYIPHHMYRSSRNKQDLNEQFILTKNLYLNPEQETTYKVSLQPSLDREKIELTQQPTMLILPNNCKDCVLSEKYWQLYENDKQARKNHVDSLQNKMSEAVNNADYTYAGELNKQIQEKSQSRSNSSIMEQSLKQMVQQNNESPVTTFFVFHELYLYRDFPAYKSSFDNLAANAKNSKYYNMIRKQYEKL
ncbi:hypothetical protein [Sphingobacterium spiritivorum]|uniref:hypothetical protein n=1 Tax=Sphingobacterium spiritivorum TaxID=258 RepID=UPI00191AED84|nr:hypothetical protein [Sphingobacterium spiritivorum]QQT26425.1 hypothetical protein I6J02_00785 [Sphingobacterium spiritivorum]